MMNILLQKPNYQIKTLPPIISCFLVFLLPLLTNAQWQNVGSPGFSSGKVFTSSIEFDGATPYIGFRDDGVSSKASVQKFDGTNWINVGTPGFSSGAVQWTDLVMNGSTPFIVFSDVSNSGKCTVMKYNGTNWVNVGTPGFSAGATVYNSIELDGNTPYVGFEDVANGSKATVMKFDGTNWVTVGSAGFSAEAVHSVTLALDGSTPYIGYRNAAGGLKANVMKYDGTNWVSVGAPDFSSGTAINPSLIVSNNIPYYCFKDNGPPGYGGASLMKFDGTNWVYVGNPGFTYNGCHNLQFTMDGDTPYVLDNELGSPAGVRVYTFDGSNWSLVGPLAFVPGSAYMDITMEGKTPFIAYQDPTQGNRCTVMKYPICECGAERPIPTVEGTYISNCSEIDGSWKNYCDDRNQLLLSLKIGTSGAVVEDNEVQLKIGNPLATFYQQGCSATPSCFIQIPEGSAIINRNWEVFPTTQPTNGNVGVKFYYTQQEYDDMNTLIDDEGQTQLTGMNQLWFYKVKNSALGEFPPISTIQSEDVQIIENHSTIPDTNQWVFNIKTSGSEYQAEYTVSSFSGGGGGGASGGLLPLPIELIYFHAYPDNRNAKLKWATASETNNQGFEIQRSNDGNRWEVIGFENGKGNTNTISNYSFTDKNPNGGLNYYRLKQIDTDGKSEFLPIKTVDMENISATEIDIYPNPAHDFLNITNVKGKGMIYNISGQLQFEIDLVEDGINTIDVSRLEQGIYQLVLEKENGERYVKRFFK